MISHHVYYQLAILGFLWLCIMLHCGWPSRSTRSHLRPAAPVPLTCKHKRSTAPKPFEGLTQRPHCAACEHDANGHPSGGPWRQLYCRSCKGYFLETHGTLFHGKRVAVELIVRVLACLAEGLGIRGTARVFEIDPNTVLQWLLEAAEHLKTFSAYFLCDVHVRQLQLDELYAVLRAVKDSELSQDEAIQRLARSPHWVWTAMDPLWEAFHNGSYRRSIVMYRRTQPILMSSAYGALLAFDN